MPLKSGKEATLSYLDDRARAKELLDNEYDWPANFMFKFIIPREKEEDLRSIFPVSEVSIRESKKGNYIGVTVSLYMNSSEDVLAIYYQANQIPGLIAL